MLSDGYDLYCQTVVSEFENGSRSREAALDVYCGCADYLRTNPGEQQFAQIERIGQ